MANHLRALLLVGLFQASLAAGCSGDESSAADASTNAGGASGSAGSAGSSGDAGSAGASSTDCSGATAFIDQATCAANAFLATLSSTELTTVNPSFSSAAARTQWSNLPGVTRGGIQMGQLSTASQTAALALLNVVLSEGGMADLTGVRAADDYLGSQGSGMGGPGGGNAYAAANYSVAVFGTPGATGNWEVMFGGHHMAYNIAFLDGVAYPIPNHLGVEPKSAFTVNGASFAPMEDEGVALSAVYKSLSAEQLAAAYLAGQKFSDVLIGPLEYGSGSSAAAKAKFPTGANRTGVLVSSLSAEQQALVTTAIAAWVGDYNSAIAADLIAAYTSAEAYADTYIAWSGTESAGVDVDVDGTYMRIDGPRAWIELACQAGVVIQGQTHFHSIYRDKQLDYGGTL